MKVGVNWGRKGGGGALRGCMLLESTMIYDEVCKLTEQVKIERGCYGFLNEINKPSFF